MRKLSFLLASSAAIAMALPAAAHAQDKDLAETAIAAGTYKSFVRALTEAGLTETLKGPGPFTVLIPSDDAFAKLPAGKLDALMKDKSALKDVLLYHLIAGRLTAADFAKMSGRSKKTVEGSDAKVTAAGDQITIGTAHIITADVSAKNGIIHIIDAVLIPPGR